MSEVFDTDARRAIRTALARDGFQRDTVRLIDTDLAGITWLVATHRGLYAVSRAGTKLIVHGWFFGIRRHGENLYLFENCGLRMRSTPMGRLVRLTMAGDAIVAASVLAKGFHPNCHQLAVIDETICLLDTANQTILRFALDGTPLEPVRPFPAVPIDDASGAYHHINAIAEHDGRIAILLHNGKARPERNSQLAWFDKAWNEIERTELPGRMCHDVVADPDGLLWHCASLTGEIVSADGQRVPVIDGYMTRGLAFTDDMVIVGYSTFGPRKLRDGLRGGVVIMDRRFATVARHELDGPPADIVPIGTTC